jgi:hypothetical protein
MLRIPKVMKAKNNTSNFKSVDIVKIWFRAAILLLMIMAFFAPHPSRAQSDIRITIQEPAEGLQVGGPFTVQGTISQLPPENRLALRVSATSTGERLIDQPVQVSPQAGTQGGTFRITLNYRVAAITPAVVEVIFFSPQDGSVVAKGDVRVVLRPYDNAIDVLGPADLAAIDAVRLALIEYEGRVQVTTPLPVSVENRAFANSCLDLGRPNESCLQSQTPGKVVRLAFGGVEFTYHVGNNQARLNEANSAPINQKGDARTPPALLEASASTGVKLYVPGRLTGPFQGLFFRRVDWENGIVTIIYGAENNPLEIRIVERAGNAAPPPAKPNGENIDIGTAKVPVQVDGGRRYVEWVIQTTIVNLSVPENISTADLAALANDFTLLGTAQPGQTDPLIRTTFTQLTLNLPEPIRSVEMARQAFMGLVKPTRLGSVISIQPRQFANDCLDLPRQGETCPQNVAAVPGYILGVSDTELFRYNVAGEHIRLNRENSELRNKVGLDFATVEGVRSAAAFVAAPTDANLTLLGAELSQPNNVPTALLIYREKGTNGVIALRETTSSNPPPPSQDQPITIGGVQVPLKSDGNGRTVTFLFGGKGPLVTAWASPEIGTDVIERVANSLAAQ